MTDLTTHVNTRAKTDVGRPQSNVYRTIGTFLNDALTLAPLAEPTIVTSESDDADALKRGKSADAITGTPEINVAVTPVPAESPAVESLLLKVHD
jgi:hypothetical protein